MNYTDKITRIIVDMYKPNGPKNKSNVDVYDMSDSFNARVGDEQIPLMIEYRERGIIERMTSEILTPFAMGYVGQPDEHGKVTAETGVAVSYHGSSDDIIGAGKVKMDLPGAMFPQEGMFYGFFGLENSAGKRITSNDVCFEVKNGNPDMYVDSMPFRSELQKLLDWATAQANSTLGGIGKKWEALRDTILEMIKQGDTDLTSLTNRIGLAEDELDKLIGMIDDKNLLTQDDVNDLLKPFQKIEDSFNNYKGLDNPWLSDVSSTIQIAVSDYASTINNDDGVIRILNLQDIHLTGSRTSDPGYVAGGHAVMKQIHALSLIRDKVDMAVVNGDNADGHESRAMNLHRDQEIVNTIHAVLGNKPTLLTIGNHDDGSVWLDGQDVLTLDELTDVYDYPHYACGESRPEPNATYSYYDFNDAKIRVISLSGFENPDLYNEDGTLKYKRANNSVFTAKQLNWLVQALKVGSDWSVIIFNHSPYEGFYNNAPYSTMTNINHNVLKDILKAFVDGTKVTSTGNNPDYPASITADFTEQGKGTLIANVFGHEHRDADKTEIDGIPAILRTCDIATKSDRVIGTTSEFALDVIEINPAKRNIKFNRFGSGSSVQWTY